MQGPAAGDDAPAARALAAAARITSRATHLERELAVSTLTGLGSASLPAARELAAAREPFKRLAAVEVLIGLQRNAEDFTPFLSDESFAVRTAAIEGIRNAFGRCGGRAVAPAAAPNIASLLPCLNDSFWPVRRAAVIALAASGNPDAATPVLAAVADPEPEVRRAALFFVSELNGAVSAADLRRVAADLDSAERLQLMKSALFLARPENAAFFCEEAEGGRGDAASLWALAGAVAAGDTEAEQLAVALLPSLVVASIENEMHKGAAASLLLAWAAGHRRADLIQALETLIAGGRPGPEQIIPHAAAILRRDSVPILSGWAERRLGDVAICALCIAHLDTGYTRDGAEALAGLIPRLRGELLLRAVDKAVHFIDQAPAGALISALTPVALQHSPAAAVAAFGGLCRVDDLDPALAESLIERFRREEDPELRSAFARSLASAARGQNRTAVWLALVEEIEQRRPAAAAAAAFVDAAAAAPEAERTAAALIGLIRGLDAVDDRENMLLALCRVNAPGTDSFLAQEAEAIWNAQGSRWACRLATAFGSLDGAATADLLKRMAGQEDETLKKRAIQALLNRRDPAGIAAAREAYPLLSSTGKRALLGRIEALGLAREASDILVAAVLDEKDSGILEAAVDALDADAVQALSERLTAMVRDPAASGMEAAVAAIRALARSGNAGAIRFVKEIAADLPPLPEGAEAWRAGESAGEALAEQVELAAAAACSLAEQRDPDAAAILARLLLQEARAERASVVIETWLAEAGGPAAREAHVDLRNVLVRVLLLLPDEMIEDALIAELDRLEESGGLFVMGDAAFGVVHRELRARGRCPRSCERLRELVVRCRPLLSPAEFRISIALGDEAAGRDRPAEAAEHYLRAYFIARFNPPAAAVLREELQSADLFAGYDPVPALFAEACALLAVDRQRSGNGDEAAALREKAARAAPFLRRPSDEEPAKANAEREGDP